MEYIDNLFVICNKVWIYDYSQLVRVILSRPREEVSQQQDEIVAELRNATQHRIIVDELRYHVDSMGRIRMDWSDLFFHAVEPNTKQISPVDEVLKVIDANYDYLRVSLPIKYQIPTCVQLASFCLAGLLCWFCY